MCNSVTEESVVNIKNRYKLFKLKKKVLFNIINTIYIHNRTDVTYR